MLQVWQGWSFHIRLSFKSGSISRYHHSQNYHKGGYSPLKTNEPNSENTLATLAKAVNDLSLLLKGHTHKSHNSFQSQNHTHRHQHQRHSSHTKNSYHNRPDHSNRHRSQTLKIVHTTNHTIALTIDHTIIHKTDHTIGNNTNTALVSMK